MTTTPDSSAHARFVAPRNRSMPSSVVIPHHAHAKAAGVRILAPPTDHPSGERQYSVEDLAGHCWTFSQTIADVDPRTWGGTLLGRAPGDLFF